MARVTITDASGRKWQQELLPRMRYTIGRSPSNHIVLRDPRASRHHAEIRTGDDEFLLVDGGESDGEFKRSVNHVFIKGAPVLEKKLADGDEITIGASSLVFENIIITPEVRYDNHPLGRTQFLLSANDVMESLRNKSVEATQAAELETLRRKAKILDSLYEMSKALTKAFNLETIFGKATEIIFEATEADRVVALLKSEDNNLLDTDAELMPVATKAKTRELDALTRKLTVSRTITRKVMNEGLAMLSQDARADAQFSAVESIVSQGVRSTICAPLVTESGVHGVLYADRLDPFATFSPDHLALLSAIAANIAVAFETIRAHERLAREEVTRANYGRFLPPYVVQQLLEKPDSFALGGTNQTVTVLFADIRGFTRLAERARPEKMVQLLNRYFTEMTEIIFTHGGTLDKYIGDGLMALFGAPTASPDDAANAIRTAVAMQQRVVELNEELQADGFAPLGVGIGLHTGEALVGYIGSEKRSEYTAIGDTVNLAARLESNSTAGQILLSDATAQAATAKFPLVQMPPITVKNREQAVPLFAVQWR